MTTATTKPKRDRHTQPILPPPRLAPPVDPEQETNWLGAMHLFSVWEAAVYLHTSESAVRDLLDAGKLAIIAGPHYAGIPVWQLEALHREIQQG